MALKSAAASTGMVFSLKDPKVVVLCVVAALALVVFVSRMLLTRPPSMDGETLTEQRLSELVARVQVFATNEQRLPQSVSEVPEGANAIAGANDGWGRPFVLEPGEHGSWKTSLAIRSFGKDGTQGSDDDYVTEIIFGDDGYGKLGSLTTESRRGK